MSIYFSRESVILISSSLLLILHSYFPLYSEPELFPLSVLFYLFIVPVVLIHFLGAHLKEFGFRWGKWPFRKDRTALVGLLVFILLIALSFLPQFQDYYVTKMPSETWSLILYIIFFSGSILFAWEFFFRGFLLFGLKDRFGEFAIVIQAVPFALMHIGKPPIEAFISVFAGLALGYIAYRSESFIPAFIIHWLISIPLKVSIFVQLF